MLRVLHSLLFFLLTIFAVSGSLPFYGYRLRPFHDYQVKMERVGPSKDVAPIDIKQSKSLGPNVCVKRIRVGMQTKCILIDRKYNCSLVSQYRSVFNCCPGFVTLSGKSGCPKELFTSKQNLVELAKYLKLNTFVSMIEQAGLTQILSKSKDKFTIFAPSEAAFRSLDKKLVKRLSLDKKALSRFLLYHMINGKVPTSGFEDGQILETTAANKKIRFNTYYRGQLMLINGARITRPNNGASNGIIHVINSVIMPPKYMAMDILAKNKDTSLFRKALVLSNIEIPHGYTVFAPTNKAFNDMDSAFFERLLKSPKCLKNLLLNHLLQDTVFTEVVADEGELFGVRTKEGTAYYMTRINRTVMIDKASVLKRDIIAKDTIVHVIDTVLVPTSAMTVIEIAKQRGAVLFTRLIKELGLSQLLSEDKQFTLFAPTDEALRQFIKNSSEAVLGNISDIIKYHIVPSSLQTCDFKDDMVLDTLAGSKKIRVNVYNYGQVNSVQGVCLASKRCNIRACNGAVHVISRPLIAPTNNLKTIIEKDSRFTAFSAALKKAKLYFMLNQSMPITLFAPTNAAFSKISPKRLESLLADEKGLKDLLEYHIVSGSLFPCALIGMCPVATMSGRSLLLQHSPQDSPRKVLTVNQDVSSKKHLVATNGIMYPVDAVLEPRRRTTSSFQRFWRAFAPGMP